MRDKLLVAAIAIFSSTPVLADSIGHGTDGPSAAPTNPDETTDDGASFWDTVLETFDLSSDE